MKKESKYHMEIPIESPDPVIKEVLEKAGFKNSIDVELSLQRANTLMEQVQLLPGSLHHHEPSNRWFYKNQEVSYETAIKLASQPYTKEKFRKKESFEGRNLAGKAMLDGLKLDKQARKALEPDPEDKRFNGEATKINDPNSIARSHVPGVDKILKGDALLTPENTTRLRNSASCNPIEGLDHG